MTAAKKKAGPSASDVETTAPEAAEVPPSVAARESEANDGIVTIEQCGLQLQVPVDGKMPYKAGRAFRAGDEDLGIELILGEEQWNAVLDTNPTFDEMNELSRKIGAALGN